MEERQSWFMSLSNLAANEKTIVLRDKAIMLNQVGEDENIVTMVARNLLETTDFNTILNSGEFVQCS